MLDLKCNPLWLLLLSRGGKDEVVTLRGNMSNAVFLQPLFNMCFVKTRRGNQDTFTKTGLKSDIRKFLRNIMLISKAHSTVIMRQ